MGVTRAGGRGLRQQKTDCTRTFHARGPTRATAGRDAGTCLVLLAASAFACTDPATRTSFTVLILADSEVREKVVDVEVQVEVRREGGSSWRGRGSSHFDADLASPSAWPLTVRVGPEQESSDGTYQVIATARDSHAAVIGQVRVVSTLARAARRGLRLTFEASCLGRMELCGAGLTCSGGECVSAVFDPNAPTNTGTTSSAARASDAGVPAARAPSATGIAAEGEPCDVDGEGRCSGFASTLPLRCESATWKRQPECAASQRCDTSESRRGQCQPIARECMGRTADVPFCDQEMMHVCSADLLDSDIHPCSADQRCGTDSKGGAACVCLSGMVKGIAGCQEATDCSHDNGGCDRLTMCESNANAIKCTACPMGFGGTGETGCVPKLAQLAVSVGELAPAFAPETLEYRVRVPLLVQSVTLAATAPEGAQVTFNGVASAEFVTPPLSLGDNEIEVVASAPSGMSKSYRVVVERQGAEDAYIKATRPSSNQAFGYCVAVSGDTLVACAPQEDSAATGVNGDATNTSAPDSGAVFVFVRRDGSWKQQAYLKPSNTNAQDIFGAGVAIEGDTLVVGAIRQDPFEVTLSNPPTRYGSVFVFTRTGDTWSQQTELVPTQGSVGDGFGKSVSLQRDTLVVGAFADGSLGQKTGAAYIYARTGTSWNVQQKLVPSVKTDDALFGFSVSIAGDTLAIGAMEDSLAVNRGGVVYVFTRRGEMWLEQQRIDPRRKEAEFGFAVALRGDRLLIGAPHVMAPDFPDQPPGEVYVYERPNAGASFAQAAVLMNPLPERHDCFGFAVALGDDLIAASAVWENGSSRGLRGDPTQRGASHTGAAYLFAHTREGWKSPTYIKASNAGPDDRFGTSLALSDELLIVGAVKESNSAAGINPTGIDDAIDGAGAVYVFR